MVVEMVVSVEDEEVVSRLNVQVQPSIRRHGQAFELSGARRLRQQDRSFFCPHCFDLFWTFFVTTESCSQYETLGMIQI